MLKRVHIEDGCAFHKMSLTFRKGIYFKSYFFSSCELSEGNRYVYLENPKEDMCQGKDTFC